ncbi:MAG: polysaccharide biosynthesis tyrosine autokinase [Actinomycetota bacterium]
MPIDKYAKGLREYLRILRRQRLVVAATLLVVVIATGLVSIRMTPIYEAAAELEIQPVALGVTEATNVLEQLVDPQRGLQTQVELIRSEAVVGRAAEDLGLDSSEVLHNNLDVNLKRDTQIVEITVLHSDPREAERWANGVAGAYIDYRRDRAIQHMLIIGEELTTKIEEVQGRIEELDRQTEGSVAAQERVRAERDALVTQRQTLESQLRALPGTGALRQGGGDIIAEASAGGEPVRPNLMVNLAVGTAVGAMLALGFAFLVEELTDKIRRPEEIEERLGGTILGYLPAVKPVRRGPPTLVMLDDPTSGASEAFRTLRTNLRFLSLEQPLRTILITSAMPGEGKTTTASNLAVAFAQAGTKTILLSADLRRPTAHKLFGLHDTSGVVDSLNPDFPLEISLQETEVRNLRFMGAGGLPPNPTEILGSARFAALLESLADLSGVVVIDATPILGLADASALAHRVDAVVFVVDPHRLTRRELSHAGAQMRKAGGTILGAVINSVEPEEGYGYYYQQYYFGLDEEEETEEELPKPVEEPERQPSR